MIAGHRARWLAASLLSTAFDAVLATSTARADTIEVVALRLTLPARWSRATAAKTPTGGDEVELAHTDGRTRAFATSRTEPSC